MGSGQVGGGTNTTKISVYQIKCMSCSWGACVCCTMYSGTLKDLGRTWVRFLKITQNERYTILKIKKKMCLSLEQFKHKMLKFKLLI